MSPAKRLSRQRFRALCVRCADWLADMPTPEQGRMRRHYMDLVYVRGRHSDKPWTQAAGTVRRLARLAR